MRGLVGAVAALSCALALVSTPATAQDGDDAPVRILLVGDSVTHGSSGDWTWRYRLWKHLRSSGTDVDLVGPRNDVYLLGSENQWSQDYLDPDFDRDHAARWGLSFALPDHPIGELVTTFRPDVVVAMLGVNDLTWLDKEADEVVELARGFMADARAADPTVDLVMARVPQTWKGGAVDYNALLPSAVAEFDLADAPAEVAFVDQGFEERTHTWDSAHPNAAGEILLAAGVQAALTRLGIGSDFPRPLSQPPLGPRRAPTLTGRASDGRVHLSWSRLPGADRQIIEWRDRTRGGHWLKRDAVWTAEGFRWSARARNGHRYEFRLRPAKGYWAAAPDVHSNEVSLVPRPASPALVRGTASPFGRVALTWPAVTGAAAYQIRYRRAGAGRWQVRPRQKSRRARIGGLRGRRSYEFAVRTWKGGGASRYRSSGGMWVPAPRAVRRTRATSPRRDTVRVTFRGRPEAVRYRVLVARRQHCRARPRSAAFRHVQTVRRPRALVGARSRALWVRVVAVRSGVPGRVGAGSIGCTRVR